MSFVRRMVQMTVASALVAACGDGGGFPDAMPIDAAPMPGRFTLAWALTDPTRGVILCEDIDALSVTALVRNRAVQGGSTEVFTCPSLMGTSQDVVPGIYDIDFELIGPGGDPSTGVIATAPRQQGVTIGAGQTVALAPLAFEVDATGGLALNLTTNASGGNCGATATGGAGITSMTITLFRATDLPACEPVTFAISAGATGQARTYTVDCTTPAPTACIESDQTLTATGLASGDYTIHVRGTTTTVSECRTNDDTLPVPPLGRDLTRTLNLGVQTSGC